MKSENRIFPVSLLVMLAVMILFRQDALYKIPVWVWITISVFVVCSNLFLFIQKKEVAKSWLPASICSMLLLFVIQWGCCFRDHFKKDETVILWSTVALGVLLVAGLIYLFFIRPIDEETVFLLLFCGLLIRVFYVVMTQANYYQNDMGKLVSGGDGHLGYIYTIYETGKLPDKLMYQFYHPPLHHIVAAGVMRIATLLGAGVAKADEIIQCLSLFYVTASLGLMNKIALRLQVSARARAVAVGLGGFLPYGVMMSGAVNNDPLMTLLVMAFIYFTMKWYEKPTIPNIIPMALCIGGGMMSKMSAVLIAPAGAIVMLVKLWQERRAFGRYVKQFLVFGAIAFPLGLWHSIRNMILFHLPLGYVPGPAAEKQLITDNSLWTRLFDLTGQLEQYSLRWNRHEALLDHNIFTAVTKCTVFGESDYYRKNPIVEGLGTAMFWLTAVLFAALLVGGILWLKKGKSKTLWKVFFSVGAGTILFSYIKFCFDYPYVCTMNVRYVMAAIYIGLVALAAGSDALAGRRPDKAGKGGVALRVFTVVYMVCCSLLILNFSYLT